MDTRELMIGDKVLVKVLSQIPNTYSVHTWTAKDYLRNFLQVKPIELTAEILEKNGLKYEVDYGGYHRSILGSHSKDNVTLICVQWNPQGEISQWEVSNKSGIYTGVVAYGYTAIAVHELQHILRMVGLDDLANSIIV